MQTVMSNEEISRLLPFWVNGSLAEPEAQAVRQALGESPALREEEHILRVLRAGIQTDENPVSPGAFGLARLNRALDAETIGRIPATRFWAGAGIAAAFVSGVTIGMLLLKSPPQQPKGHDLYQQASGEAGPGQLTVVFEPTATQAEIEALLVQFDLRIVDGPSALGLYQLRAGDEDTLTRALAALRAADRIIETAEPTE